MSHFPSDTVLLWLVRGCGLLTGTITVVIVGFLLTESLPALQEVGIQRFVSDPSWHPSAGSAEGEFNLVPMIVATSLATAGAVLLATPLGIGSAIFAHFYAPNRLRKIYGKMIELLAGIPSVVYGLWGLVVLVPIIARWHPPGTSLLSAIIVLTIMILPTIALLAGASFDNLSSEHLRASAALGLSRGRTVFSVVLPASRSGLFTAVLLGTGRAVGETMAVLMVAGNVVQTPTSLFQPVRTITANIALEMAYAMDGHRSALFVCGLLLMAMIVLLVGTAEWVSKGRIHG
ncbi:Phosphate transport system permease protein PstC [Roseimaritima multifibrata]|uniref:Phosphate transport system permease protein n=1 Tax=Roseimaritima multifibrata TaxID=1930274 RepID=A0A517MI20_9BACT|nr:phosphate ABC transporter permease subunit PstC [Roseimaritima multifibrata]QDS94520.1 Phosphate transport system permease protein PstC [Roseimaritima multifibrata]